MFVMVKEGGRPSHKLIFMTSLESLPMVFSDFQYTEKPEAVYDNWKRCMIIGSEATDLAVREKN